MSNASSLSVLGKYLDQPMLVSKFSKAVPAALVVSGGLFTYSEVKKTHQDKKRDEFIKTATVLTTTIASALIAPKIASKLIKSSETSSPLKLFELKKHQKKLVEEFLSKNNVDDDVKLILEKAKEKVLNIKQIKILTEKLSKNVEGKIFLNTLIPNPENINSKHIFGEIKRLSILGLIPVLGGVAGGIAGDKMTDKDWKDKIPNKIKEGSYQYLANIFLCNVGAGAALAAMEKAKITSKAARAAGIVSGIILTGIICGSAIANSISKKIIDPFLYTKNGENKNRCRERTPELLDVGLHVDDIATVAVMSGLKWIEPALPVLYSISGFRAGIGYRNGCDKANCKKQNKQ